MISREALLDRYVSELVRGPISAGRLSDASVGDVEVANLARFADRLIEASYMPLNSIQVARGARLIGADVTARAGRGGWSRIRRALSLGPRWSLAAAPLVALALFAAVTLAAGRSEPGGLLYGYRVTIDQVRTNFGPLDDQISGGSDVAATRLRELVRTVAVAPGPTAAPTVPPGVPSPDLQEGQAPSAAIEPAAVAAAEAYLDVLRGLDAKLRSEPARTLPAATIVELQVEVERQAAEVAAARQVIPAATARDIDVVFSSLRQALGVLQPASSFPTVSTPTPVVEAPSEPTPPSAGQVVRASGQPTPPPTPLIAPSPAIVAPTGTPDGGRQSPTETPDRRAGVGRRNGASDDRDVPDGNRGSGARSDDEADAETSDGEDSLGSALAEPDGEREDGRDASDDSSGRSADSSGRTAPTIYDDEFVIALGDVDHDGDEDEGDERDGPFGGSSAGDVDGQSGNDGDEFGEDDGSADEGDQSSGPGSGTADENEDDDESSGAGSGAAEDERVPRGSDSDDDGAGANGDHDEDSDGCSDPNVSADDDDDDDNSGSSGPGSDDAEGAADDEDSDGCSVSGASTTDDADDENESKGSGSDDDDGDEDEGKNDDDEDDDKNDNSGGSSGSGSGKDDDDENDDDENHDDEDDNSGGSSGSGSGKDDDDEDDNGGGSSGSGSGKDDDVD